MNRILGSLQNSYINFASKLDDSEFCQYLNLLSRFKGLKTRFNYENSHGFLSFNDGEIGSVYFARKERAGFYLRGGNFRAKHLASEYLIDKIDFADGDIILDCGANIGELGVWFSRVIKKK